jgi:hypothetical protein
MASPREFGSIRHLVGRFVGSLLPVGPPRGDELWARKHLLPGERTLWQRMSGADRRHAVAVARRTLTDLDQATGDLPVAREVVAAALLHDVGKIEAALGTWARAGVTVAAMAVGREHLIGWSGTTDCRSAGPEVPATDRRRRRGRSTDRPVWRQRIGLYLGHDRVGAELLSGVGSDPFTIAWAGEHHRPPERWSVDARLGEALKVADDD